MTARRSRTRYWKVALVGGLVAALVVAVLLGDPREDRASIERRSTACSGRRQGRRQHRQHPAARGDRAGAGPDRRGGRGAGRLHERPHRRVRRGMSDHAPAGPAQRRARASSSSRCWRAALIVVRRGSRISHGLATLAAALQGVEAEHLRPLEPAVTAINAQFESSSARCRASPEGRDRGRAEADMILWWIGNAVLLSWCCRSSSTCSTGCSAPRRASCRASTRSRGRGGRVADLDATALLADDAGPGGPDGRGGRRLRRLARRDPRRRV